MPEIDPITREEKLWSGEDIEPITREEMYIKHIFDKTQPIPSKPITRKEMLLEKAGEGGGSDVTIKQLSVTENGTYSEEGTAYSPVIVNVPAPPIPDNAYLLNEVEGLPSDIASFSDGSNLPMPKLEVAVEPQQDLHGYDHPWVGGAGKNKLPFPYVSDSTTVWGITFTVNDDGTITANGTATNSIYLDLIYNFSLSTTTSYILTGSVSGCQIYVKVKDSEVYRDYGNGVTFTPSDIITNVTMYIPNGTVVNNAVFKPMIRLASVTDSTFEPYSNICPIIGHTEANVVVSPTTDAEDGQTYNIQFKDGSNPLTVYGGSLDVINGTSGNKKTLGYVNLGNPTWGYNNGRFYYNPTDAKVYAQTEVANMLCSQYPISKYLSQADNSISSYAGYIYVRADSYGEDVTAFKQAMSGVQLVYELATPTTFESLATPIKSLSGSNNVWADTGKIEELEYFGKEV